MNGSLRVKSKQKAAQVRGLLLSYALVFSPFVATAQSTSPHRANIEGILEFSQVESITSGIGKSLVARVSALAGDLSLDEQNRLRSAISSGFIQHDLHSDIVGFMSVEAKNDVVETVLERLRTGAISEIRRIESAYTPSQSLEKYAAGLEGSMPSGERLNLAARWAAAQSTGDFYIILEEAEREAAHELLRAVRGDAPAFVPLSHSEYEREHESQTGMAVLSLLYRFETVSNELLREAIAEYESESGQWYIESYTFGIVEALWLAGQRAARQLSGVGVMVELLANSPALSRILPRASDC